MITNYNKFINENSNKNSSKESSIPESLINYAKLKLYGKKSYKIDLDNIKDSLNKLTDKTDREEVLNMFNDYLVQIAKNIGKSFTITDAISGKKITPRSLSKTIDKLKGVDDTNIDFDHSKYIALPNFLNNNVTSMGW